MLGTVPYKMSESLNQTSTAESCVVRVSVMGTFHLGGHLRLRTIMCGKSYRAHYIGKETKTSFIPHSATYCLCDNKSRIIYMIIGGANPHIPNLSVVIIK